MRRALQFILPLGIVGLTLLLIWLLDLNKPEAKPVAPAYNPPLVDTVTATASDGTFFVLSQGTVEPRSEINLVSQVSGRILTLGMQDGGFFAANDTLVTLDDVEYRAALATRKAELAQAKLTFARERAEADTAVEQWRKLNPNAKPPELVARIPQVTEANARVEAATAAVARAQLDLDRATITAPFDGRVRDRMVDEHQVVAPGMTLAQIYATDYVEVRLPIANAELAFLDMPFVLDGGGVEAKGPVVTFAADYAGRAWTWQGRIHRAAGSVDAATRRVTLVAKVNDPFGTGRADNGNGDAHNASERKPPLQVGMFVRARITGRPTGDLLAVPRSAVRNGNQLLVLDADWRVRIQNVEIARSEAETAWIRSGIELGAQIITSNLQTVVDGMQVRVSGEEIPSHVQIAIDARRRGETNRETAADGDPRATLEKGK